MAPPAPAPAHGDGPTGPSAPTGHTEPRDLAWFLARTPPSDGHAPPRTPGDWNRQSIAAFIARHSPEEAPMPEPADRPPSLRERLAETLHCPTCGVEPGAHCLRARVDNRQPHMTRVQAADAVMPVVEAETAALRQRIEEVEDQRDQALAWQDTAERERDEERAIRQQTEEALAIAHDTSNRSERARQAAERAIAAERRDKLTAEAAVRRARELARNRIAVPSDVLREALTIEQPEDPTPPTEESR